MKSISNFKKNIYTDLYNEGKDQKEHSINYSFPSENLIRAVNLNKFQYPIKEKSNALDIGCGDARHVEYLSNLGYKVLGTDVSNEAINLSKKRKYKTEVNFRKVNNSIIDKSDFRGCGKFDLIICWDTLHWFSLKENISSSLKVISSSLKKEGFFIFNLVGENDYRLKDATIYNKPPNTYLVQNELEKGMQIYYEDLTNYIQMINNSNLKIEYISWHTHGRIDKNIPEDPINIQKYKLNNTESWYVFGCSVF